jgi:hypothetical protein
MVATPICAISKLDYQLGHSRLGVWEEHSKTATHKQASVLDSSSFIFAADRHFQPLCQTAHPRKVKSRKHHHTP